MHDYSEMKRNRGYRVNQTLDAPILVFEFWELSEIFVALGLILIFGVLFYEWALLCCLLAVTLIGLPYLRRHFNRGMEFHYPYRKLGMSLPGLINPKFRTRMSD